MVNILALSPVLHAAERSRPFLICHASRHRPLPSRRHFLQRGSAVHGQDLLPNTLHRSGISKGSRGYSQNPTVPLPGFQEHCRGLVLASKMSLAAPMTTTCLELHCICLIFWSSLPLEHRPGPHTALEQCSDVLFTLRTRE